MNKKYFLIGSIIIAIYIFSLIFQFLDDKIHLYRFIIEYWLYTTIMVGAYASSKKYNSNESLIAVVSKKYKFVYLLSFIPLIILLIIGNTIFMFSNIEIQNCKRNLFPDSCISQIAIKKNDYLICKKSYPLNNIKSDNCLSDFAKTTGDITICDLVDKKIYSEISEKDFCLQSIAEKHNIIKACDGLSDTTQKNNCYFGLAQDFNNREACKKMVPIEYGWQPHHCETLFRNK